MAHAYHGIVLAQRGHTLARAAAVSSDFCRERCHS